MPGSVFGRKWREISAVVNSERFAGLNISPPMQCEVMRNDLDSECDRKLSTVNDKYRNECSARRLEWNIVAAVLTVVFDAQLGEFFVYINYEFAGNLRDLRLVKPDSRDIQDYRLHHPGRGIWKNTYLTCTGAGFRQHFRLLHLRHNYTIIARPHIVNWWGEAGTFRTIQFDGGKVLRRLLYWSTLADPGHRYWAGLLDCSFEQMKDCEMRAVQKVLLDARRSFAWINQSRYSFPENLPHLMCAPKEKDENGEGEEERALLMSTTVRPDEDLSAGLLKVKKNGVFKFKKDGVLKGSFGVLKVKKDGSARDKVEDLDSQSAADIIEKSAPGSSTGSPVRLRFVDMGGNDLVRAKISGRDGLVKNDRTQKMEVCEDYKTLFLHTLETCGDVAADTLDRLWVGLLDETFVALTGRQKAAAKNLLNNARRICPYMNAARYGLQENLEHLVVVPAFGECEVAAARAERIVHVGLKPNGLEINNLGSDCQTLRYVKERRQFDIAQQWLLAITVQAKNYELLVNTDTTMTTLLKELRNLQAMQFRVPYRVKVMAAKARLSYPVSDGLEEACRTYMQTV
eukprot:g17929.t1